MGVPAYSSKVAGYAVVGIVAPHHRSQMDALVGDGLMPVDPTPLRNRRQRSGVTILCRYLPHHILSRPRLAPDQRGLRKRSITCEAPCLERTARSSLGF